MEFATGNAKIELSQMDVARAVEFWLNEKILRRPCRVINMARSGTTQWQSVSFEVGLEEVEVSNGAA